ncbi:MAG: ribosome biogenesis factor YjgA [Polyangiaceae bacterium]|nr:ribosome biogenesis factor YjgA [Polyangiaceae bacterium]
MAADPTPDPKVAPEASAHEGSEPLRNEGRSPSSESVCDAPEGDTHTETAEEVDELGWAGPSRSQVKREAEAATKLGQKLTGLPPGVLQHLPLTPEVREAIEVWRKLRRGAQSRQLRRLGSLLRATDLGPIMEALGRRTIQSPEEQQLEQLGELWRTRLIEGGDDVVEAFLAKYPGGDRQHLRQLARASKGEPVTDRMKRTRRELLRQLRDMIRASNASAEG